MSRPSVVLANLVAMCLCPALGAQTSSKPSPAGVADAPASYHVSFERRDAIPSVVSTSTIALPFQCTSDGTIFVNFATPPPPGAASPVPTYHLVSISRSGVPHTFALERAPGLYSVSEVDHFAHGSGLVFLVRATPDATATDLNKKPKPRRYSYLLSFDRDGTYQRSIQLEDGLRIERIAVFPSGGLLAFGFDPHDHVPKLVMLRADGTYLKSLDVPSGAMPDSAVGTEGARRGVLTAGEFVRLGSSILMLQDRNDLPILEISQQGSVKVFHAQLPEGVHLVDFIPSDSSLFALVNGEAGAGGGVYELQPEDGSVSRIFTMDDWRDAAAVACVHDGKFLSIDHGDASVTLLVGTARLSR